jgi:8-oxo-dGTP pyrophosphatase MutT (NUDIX family)
MTARGGQQRIPRPAVVRPGGSAPWAHLPVGQRHVSVGDVRALCASLPPARRDAPEAARAAAVLIPVFSDEATDDGEARVVLTKRPETMPSHQGEIAFPGGKLDPALDRDLRDAALREAHEEVGLDPARVEIVAELDTLATASSMFALAPFVGLLGDRPTLVPDPTEVAAAFDVSVAELFDDECFREERWDILDTPGFGPLMDRPVYFFELTATGEHPGETIWGATARILFTFLAALVAGR